MPTRTNVLATHRKSSYQLILVSFLLGLLAIACEDRKTVQCHQLFQTAKKVTQNNKDLNYAVKEQSVKNSTWLKAANSLTLAAERIDALKINQSQLIEYQNQLATVYRIYSQATYDAVKARENNNLSALDDARTSAIKAGKMQQKLFQEVNKYCLE